MNVYSSTSLAEDSQGMSEYQELYDYLWNYACLPHSLHFCVAGEQV